MYINIYFNFQNCVFFIFFYYYYRKYYYYFYYYQFSSNTFIDFIPNKKLELNKENNLNKELNNNNEIIIKLKNELKLEKEKNIKLNNELNTYKNKINDLNSQINSLKLELNSKNIEINNLINSYNNKINNLSKSNLDYINPGEKIMAINFISTDHKVNYCLPCKNTDIFVRLEEKLYNEYPEYKDFNTYFTVSGNIVKRFKSMEENQIKNSNVILLNIYE